MHPNVFNAIAEMKKSKQDGFRKIASYLLEYDGNYKTLKISQLAKFVYTSNSTIVRFAQALGYGGFPELRIDMYNQSSIYLGTDNNEVADKAFNNNVNAVISAIEKTQNITNLDLITQVVDDILAANIVNVFAMGETSIVAQDFSLKLIRIGINSSRYDDVHTQHFSACNSKSNTVAIGISYSGQTSQVIKNLELSKKHGAKTYLICRDKIQANDFIDYILPVEADESIARVFSTTSRFAMLFLCDIIYHEIIARDKQYYIKKLDETRIHRKNGNGR